MRILYVVLGSIFAYLIIYVFLCLVGAYAIQQAERRLYHD